MPHGTTAGKRLQRAIRFHRAGNVRGAESEYRRVLRREPCNAEALRLMGVLSAQAGQWRAAAALVAKAIEIQGPEPEYCEDLGAALEALGEAAAAAACYQQAAQSEPTAARFFRLGRALMATAQPAAAMGALERALRLNPAHPAALFELGNAFHQMGRAEDAMEAYRGVIALAPGSAEAHYNLGVALMVRGRAAEAIECFEQAVRLRPDYAEAHNNLGVLRHALGAPDRACAHYQRALQSSPDYLIAASNLGRALQDSGELEQAVRAFRDVTGRAPEDAEAHFNLANALLRLGALDEAASGFRRAIALNPAYAPARFGLGLVELTRGNFRAGWEGYQYRSLPAAPACPPWDGRPLNGRAILLQPEQGLGDTIQFIRYAPSLRALGGVVMAACRDPLVRLLTGAHGVDMVAGPLEPAADCYLPLASAPYALAAYVRGIPNRVPYIDAAHVLVEEWRERLGDPEADHLRVGLAWAGNPQHRNDRNRSLAARHLDALQSVPGATFYSLQKDAPEMPAVPMVPLGSSLTDFAETAALIRCLDLVITVDTAVAHLAGALARPVWTLLPHPPDWRWMMNRTDTPWYPTMRLFRQKRRGAWEGVIAEVLTALSDPSTRHALIAARGARWEHD